MTAPINPSPFIGVGVTKPLDRYGDMLIMADRGLHGQIAALVAATLPKGARILDFGAGQGALSQRLHDLGYSVLAVDIDAAQFKAGVPFEALDFNRPDQVAAFHARHQGQFDLVLGVEIIEHIENPWQYVRDLKNLTKPGGWIIISTPNITSWFSRLVFLLQGRFHQFEDHDYSYGHINPVTAAELRYICERTGLTVERIQPGGWLPRLWLTANPVRLLFHLIGFALSFGMRGMKSGWCIIALIRNPER